MNLILKNMFGAKKNQAGKFLMSGC